MLPVRGGEIHNPSHVHIALPRHSLGSFLL
jgi:hypothetical protein